MAPFLVDAAGDVITYEIKVFNTGNTTLTGVVVTDTLLTNLDCSADAGQQTSGLTIPVGGSITCTGTYTVLQSDINNNGGGDADIDNIVTADLDKTGPDTASAEVPLERSPSLNVTKTVKSVDADENVAPFLVDAAQGDVITYEIKVFNTGNTTLAGVVVTDTLLTNLDCSADAGQQTSGLQATIPVGGSITCTGTYTVLQSDINNNGGGDADIDNIMGPLNSDQTGPDTASAEVPLERSPSLNVTKTVKVRGR